MSYQSVRGLASIHGSLWYLHTLPIPRSVVFALNCPTQCLYRCLERAKVRKCVATFIHRSRSSHRRLKSLQGGWREKIQLVLEPLDQTSDQTSDRALLGSKIIRICQFSLIHKIWNIFVYYPDHTKTLPKWLKRRHDIFL